MRPLWNDWVSAAHVSLTATCIVTSHGRCMFWHMWTIIVGDAKLKKEFTEALSKELLVKITGELRPNTEHSFLGLRHNGDSIDILMPQKYIEDLLELYSMNKANSVNTTGSSSEDVALDAKAHSLFRTAVGKR